MSYIMSLYYELKMSLYMLIDIYLDVRRFSVFLKV